MPEKPPGRQNGSPEWGLSFCYRRSRSDHLHPVLRDIYPDSPFVSYAQTALRVSAYGRSAYRNFMYQSFLKCMIGSKTAVSSVSSSFFHATTNRTTRRTDDIPVPKAFQALPYVPLTSWRPSPRVRQFSHTENSLLRKAVRRCAASV